ncbi:hypothetical protein DFH11DRAFT_1548501 [Phellopilus nigrolimitatus]|nr:hypothetical protein DFH11DRAFT_1548501 [Phellopilus nigrolimitatus]
MSKAESPPLSTQRRRHERREVPAGLGPATQHRMTSAWSFLHPPKIRHGGSLLTRRRRRHRGDRSASPMRPVTGWKIYSYRQFFSLLDSSPSVTQTVYNLLASAVASGPTGLQEIFKTITRTKFSNDVPKAIQFSELENAVTFVKPAPGTDTQSRCRKLNAALTAFGGWYLDCLDRAFIASLSLWCLTLEDDSYLATAGEAAADMRQKGADTIILSYPIEPPGASCAVEVPFMSIFSPVLFSGSLKKTKRLTQGYDCRFITAQSVHRITDELLNQHEACAANQQSAHTKLGDVDCEVAASVRSTLAGAARMVRTRVQNILSYEQEHRVPRRTCKSARLRSACSSFLSRSSLAPVANVGRAGEPAQPIDIRHRYTD